MGSFFRTILMEIARVSGFAVAFIPTISFLNYLSGGRLLDAATSGEATVAPLFVASFAGGWIGAIISASDRAK